MEIPKRIAKLPQDEKGRPVPWFVAWIDNKPDFRIIDARKVPIALKERRCWICGEPLGRFLAFVIGPMCALNRVSSEPPSHRECAKFASIACPFLATPQMHRRERGLPENENLQAPAGISIRRNPGVVLIWVTLDFQIIGVSDGNGGLGSGVLFQVGDPVGLFWVCEGREATRAEVIASIDSGLPYLKEACEMDDDPPESLAALERQYNRVLKLIPQ
jgi:hypothetical protein